MSRGTAYLFGAHCPESLLDILPTLVSPRTIAFRVVPTPGEPARQRALLRAWREAIDACLDEPARFAVLPEWRRAIAEDGDLLPCSAATTGHL